MPKVSTSVLPLSGLFGVIKPSGPTSMLILTEIKKLAGNSRLFVEEGKLGKPDQSKKHSRKRSRLDPVKIGQGGTLDPLADGVLGTCKSDCCISCLTRKCSCWRWERNEAFESIFRVQ